MCVAIVRDGLLLFSREIPWGFADPDGAVDERLAAELRRSMLFFRQSFRAAVEIVVLCGGMPNLRSLTSSMSSALNLPVETLDSLSGIDAEAVPEPTDAFRSIVAALWPAMAVASEPGERANLLPASIRVRREKRAEILRIAVALIAGVLTVAAWYFVTDSPRQARASEVARLERRVAMLEPEAERISALRNGALNAASQRSAVTAFDTQGPRLARLLEALSHATPPEVVLSEIDAQAEGAHWRTVMNGLAVSVDPASSQNAVTGVLQRVSESPYVGPVAQAPSFRLVSRSSDPGSPGDDHDQESATLSIPEGMSGVRFSARFNIRK
jgi:hypothetical protein